VTGFKFIVKKSQRRKVKNRLDPGAGTGQKSPTRKKTLIKGEKMDISIHIPAWIGEAIQAILALIASIWTAYQHKQHKKATAEIEKIKIKMG